MKKTWWKVLAFFGGLIAVLSFWLREKLAPSDANHAEDVKKVDEKKADVAEKAAVVAVEEQKAEAVHAEVEKKLAAIDARVADERKKDSVDLANDIINGV